MIFITKKLDCCNDLNKAIEMCEFLGGEIYEKHPDSITFCVEDETLEKRGFKLDYTENRHEYEVKRVCNIKKPHVIYTDCVTGRQTVLEPDGKGHRYDYSKLTVTVALDSWYEGISSDIIELIKQQANDYGVKLQDVYFSLQFPSLSYGQDIHDKKFTEYFKNVDQTLFSTGEYKEWLNYNDSKLFFLTTEYTDCAEDIPTACDHEEEGKCQDCDCEGGNWSVHFVDEEKEVICSGCSGAVQCSSCMSNHILRDYEATNQVDSSDYCRPYRG